ncbi:MAG: DUF342 domain-containing protein, partial [Acidimicrobiales bacterium]
MVDRVADGLVQPRFRLDREVIASATPAVAGSNGSLEPAWDMGIKSGVARADGSLDFRDRALLQPVAEGTVLAVYRPPTLPVDGRGVDGSVLPAPSGIDPRPELGGGARLDEQGRVLAARDGLVRWDGARGFDVVAHLRHDGDVDLRSGHLSMEGDLTVTGQVHDGFAVRATGSIEVMGDVDGGTVVAGGDVAVRGAVLGHDHGLVSARGDLSVRRAQNATLRCGGRLELQIDAIDSTTRGTEVEVGGTVRGGTTHAELKVAVRDAGGVAVGADLGAGIPVEWPEDSARAMARVAAANRGRRATMRGGRGRGRSAMRTDSAVRAEAALRKRRFRARQKAGISLARVEVRGRAHEGVRIRIADRSEVLRSDVERTRFRLDPDSLELLREELT